jgi:arginine deiminase
VHYFGQAVEIPRSHAMMHLDTLMTMLDRATFVLYPYLDRNLQSWTVTADEEQAADGMRQLRVRHNPDLWDALTGVLAVPEVTVLATDEDIRAAEREQWGDGNNYLAVAPGLIVGYERNVATNTMLRKHGIEVITVPARNSAGAGAGRAA